MGSIWTVKPEDVRVDLTYVDADGGTHPLWVRLKKQLSVGETRRVMTAGWRGLSSGRGAAREDQRIDIDWQAQSFARAEMYITDWSLEDDKGTKLAILRDVIEALHPDVFAVLETAISAHVEASAQEKKAPDGSSGPAATSN